MRLLNLPNRQNCSYAYVGECILDYISLDFECRFTKNSSPPELLFSVFALLSVSIPVAKRRGTPYNSKVTVEISHIVIYKDIVQILTGLTTKHSGGEQKMDWLTLLHNC